MTARRILVRNRRRLQHLAGDVEGQVLGVDHALYEAQPGRQQLGLVGDEHAPDVKPDLARALALHRLERLHAGDEQQRREFEGPFRPPVQGRPGLVEVHADMAVELGVLLRGDLGFRLAPQGRALVRGLGLALGDDGDRHGDVVGPFAHDVVEPVALQILVGILLEMKDDVGAGLVACRLFQGITALALRGPGPGFVGAGAPRGHGHAVGHHEGGVEADAELADQAGFVLGLRISERLAEGAGAGTGDGAEILRQLRLGHADAGIGDRQRARGLLGGDRDLCVGRRRRDRLRQRLETAPVQGIGGVGHQFP